VTIHINGTLRKALISGCVSMVFALFAYVITDLNTRLRWLEAESIRIGKIAAGRGKDLERHDVSIEWLRQQVIELQIRYAERDARRPAPRPHN
jgi:hypothetical protein